jgi:Na+/H+ antiporter NhaC
MMMKKIIFSLVLMFFMVWDSTSQCSMCRAVLESEQDTGQAEAINDGIVYLMAFPYILVGGVLYFVYKSFQKKRSQQDKLSE